MGPLTLLEILLKKRPSRLTKFTMYHSIQIQSSVIGAHRKKFKLQSTFYFKFLSPCLTQHNSAYQTLCTPWKPSPCQTRSPCFTCHILKQTGTSFFYFFFNGLHVNTLWIFTSLSSCWFWGSYLSFTLKFFTEFKMPLRTFWYVNKIHPFCVEFSVSVFLTIIIRSSDLGT